MNKINDLREERAKLIEEARKLLWAESPTEEDLGKADELMAAAEKLKDRIDKLEAVEAEAERLRQIVDRRADIAGISSDQAYDEVTDENRVFSRYLRFGVSGLSDSERAVMARRHVQAAMGVGTDSAGGYLVPDIFYDRLITAMMEYGGMRRVSRVITTASGADMLIPTINDLSNTGAILNEGSQVGTADPTVGQVALPTYMYTSKMVLVSLQLLQDSAFDVDTWLPQALGIRIARATNAHYTTGTGTGQPRGVVTAASSGATAASATSVGYDDLVNLLHSVDPAYRSNAVFMFRDSTLAAVKRLKDSQNRPLWLPGMAVGEPDRLLGHPYVINQDVAAVGASAKSVLFGDFSTYVIRDVQGIRVMRLVERYADYLQVGFLAYLRTGGGLADGGGGAVKYLSHPAS